MAGAGGSGGGGGGGAVGRSAGIGTLALDGPRRLVTVHVGDGLRPGPCRWPHGAAAEEL